MNDSAKLRRQLHLIRCVDKPYTYPSLPTILEYLRGHDVEQVSAGTFERDLRNIRANYGITITYDRRERGYFLDVADDEDLDDFRVIIRLLERRERLEILTRPGRSVAQYLQFEQHDGFRGLDLLSPIWNALQRQLALTFQYQTYSDSPGGPRSVEPGLLFEYKNRWYLDGYDLDKQATRTFGLDRISDLELTTHPIDTKRQLNYRAARQHVIGVTAPPGNPVERVVLRFSKTQIDYVKSLPLHGSQNPLSESATHLTISLNVILNPELELLILGYGEHVEVLEPLVLREKIGERLLRSQLAYRR